MSEPHNLRVVVADDEELSLFVLMRSMNDNGYAAKGFTGGMPILKYLLENPDKADIVILDKMMCDLSGVDVIRLMKNHPVLKNIPVVMQSGCTNSEEGLSAGADRYLLKPYTKDAMLSAIKELAGSSRTSLH